jgi:hypothetical protein
MLLEAVVDAVPPIKGLRGRPGRPRRRSVKLHLDKGYDYLNCPGSDGGLGGWTYATSLGCGC